MGMIGNAPAAGIIGTGNIQDGGVETADIKDGAVVNAKLGSDLDASKLTAGTMPIARVADGAVTAAKLASTAVTDKLGYTPVNKAGDTMTGDLKVGGDAFGNAIRRLVVREDATDNSFKGMKVVNAGGSGAVAGVAFQGYDWVQGGIWHGRSASGRSGALVLGTNPDTTDLTEGGLVGRVFVDNAGRVTMPYQPACQISRSNGSETFATDASYGLGSSFLLNRGGFYFGTAVDGANKRVHVPVTGYYEVTFVLYCFYSAANGRRVSIQASSGENLCMHQMPGGSTTDETRCITNIVSLTAGDYLYFRTANYGALNLYTNNDHTEVFIKLLG